MNAPAVLPNPAPIAMVGRQPIFDRNLQLHAYELLYRSNEENAANFDDGGRATAQVINNTLIEIGFDEMVGEAQAFINFTYDCLGNGVSKLLPPERVVVEVLENVIVDDYVIENVQQLVNSGFTIALDDFVYDPQWEPLLSLAHIVKLDIEGMSDDEIRENSQRLQKHDVELLAERVETQEQFDLLKELGFDYFQGYFFAKPHIVSSQKIKEHDLNLLQILAQLQNPKVDIDDVKKLISHNISLSYKLLRYINSSLFSLPHEITSIHQAVVYFGLERLKHWVSLIVMSEMPNSPSELYKVGLNRAKFCERLGELSQNPNPEMFFTVGLFSVLDAMIDRPMTEILENISMSDQIRKALLDYGGEPGEALRCAEAFESFDNRAVYFADLDEELIYQANVEAMLWSQQVIEI